MDEASAAPSRSGLALALLVALGLLLCWRVLESFLPAILGAASLALVVHPFHQWLLRRTGRETPAALLTVLAVAACVLAPLVLLSLAVSAELGALLDEASARWSRLADRTGVTDPTQVWLQQFVERFPFARGLDAEAIRDRIAGLSESLLRGSVGVVGALLGGLVQIAILIFTLFFLLRDSGGLATAATRLVPLEASRGADLLARAREVVHASLLGVVVVALAQGALGGLLFAALGLRAPVLWGALMAIGAMIPFVGTAAVWLPWAVALALVGRWGAALALVATGVLVIGTLDNILRPVLVGGRTGMHSLVVFFAVLGGLQLFGVFGLIIGPALFAVVGSLLEQFRAATLPREGSPVGDSALSPP